MAEIGMVLAAIGFITGGIGGVTTQMQNVEDATRAAAELEQQITDARELAKLQRRQATESHALAREQYKAAMAESRNISATGEVSAEQRAGQGIFDTVVAGGRATGAAEATLATGGVRKSGSVETTIAGVGEEYNTAIKRQEQQMTAGQKMFDKQYSNTFLAEDRQIAEWDLQYRQTLEAINLNESQLRGRLSSQADYLNTQADQGSTFGAYLGAALIGANPGQFANAAANYGALQPIQTPTYQAAPYSDSWAGAGTYSAPYSDSWLFAGG